jgi:PAS domain S-box-containing protein
VGSRFQREYERAAAENKTVHFEEFYPPMGKWFEVHAYPSAAGLSVFFNDITERKQVAEALCLALQESKQRQAEVAGLLQGARSVLEHRQFQPAARAIYEACKELIGAAAGYVALLRENSEEVDLLFLDAGGAPCTVDPALPMPVRGLRAEACRTQQVVYENDFRQSAHLQFLPPGHAPVENVLFAPLVLHDRVVGLLGLANKAGGFTANDARLASAFAELATVALHNNRSLQLLETSERRFRSVAQSAGDGIVTADAEGRIVFWNPAAEQIFGYRAEEVLGQPIERIIPERSQAAHRQSFARALSTERQDFVRRPLDVVGRRKDDSELPLELSLARWKSGTDLFCTAIMRDVTERKQAEEALRRAHDELELRVQERTAELRQVNEQLRREIEVRRQTERELTEAE